MPSDGSLVFALVDDHDALVLVERNGHGLIDSEVLLVMLGKAQGLAVLVHAEDALQLVDVEPRGEGNMLECPCYDVPRGTIPLQFDDYCASVAIYTERIDEPSEVGSDLTADDQEPPVFENSVRVGFQPLLKDGLLANDLGKAEDPKTWSEEKTRNETDIICSRLKKTTQQELADDPYAQLFSSTSDAWMATRQGAPRRHGGDPSQ